MSVKTLERNGENCPRVLVVAGASPAFETWPDFMERFLHQKFEAQVAPPNDKGCRIWTGIVKAGRGMFLLSTNPHRWMSAAKWAYQFYTEPVPKGFHALPRCGERLCVEHLHLKSSSEIIRAAMKRGFKPFPELHKFAPHRRGLENPRGRWSDEVVREIFNEWRGGEKIQVIAMRRKMATSTVWWICTGRFRGG